VEVDTLQYRFTPMGADPKQNPMRLTLFLCACENFSTSDVQTTVAQKRWQQFERNGGAIREHWGAVKKRKES
jgi:hypothetical protein